MERMPEDIDRTATDIVQMRTGDDPEWETYVAIARAILAERKRCAEVALREGDKTQPAVGYLISKAIEAGA